jgi:hypothetical protein
VKTGAKSSTQLIIDRVVFLLALLAGLATVIWGPAHSQQIGEGVVVVGLFGLVSSHSLAPFLAALEQNLAKGFLSPSLADSASASPGSPSAGSSSTGSSGN